MLALTRVTHRAVTWVIPQVHSVRALWGAEGDGPSVTSTGINTVRFEKGV
ncbi:MAG: hypothetical protein QOE54_6759 [Streptosporangiaceae bacterium]|jgi:hypothetical protein|nr:hypothetical protein [Streptosporangiaceae bacterium]